MMNRKLFSMALGVLILTGSGGVYSSQHPQPEAVLAPGTGAVDDAVYRENCGKCHLPFPAGLLPALSWEKMMMGLQDHFGQQVRLSPQSERAIYSYLLTNAAGRVSYRVSNDIMGSLGSDPAPLRITGTAYFKQRHKAVGDKTSLISCDQCHDGAIRGDFSVTERR